MSAEIVKVHNLTKKYQAKAAIKDLSFVIHAGERIGIIGANGSGKSTLSEIIAGIRTPTRGEIIKSPNLRIGIQFQDSKYPMGITVMDMVRYYCDTFKIKYHKDELLNLLATYQLTNLAKKNINSLSGGQQQRLNILLAVIHQPDLVILDEVSSGLDIEVKEIIFTFLETNIIANNRAMLLVSHNMEEIERFCERILYLHAGELKADTTVKAVVKEYGSVFNYTKAMFDYYKKHESADIQN
ncbi:ABC transporter ATP-binding protein [Spiroplasma eriocheiris]|uniref:ABC transporter ATP-binding protein n=1 Tax=Spiroplasma eriocheiris TaxID=315358 RepID=A0A0H3XJ33_9MOLU|nr:ABC transporter ATP-binding protein [Spiroplasma eriocheiris]AHF58133.1 ABC-type transport system ATP-binding protein [Spiroplasma eriocheiris CCTCC M 207170]AKM54570.1 ABC transporter ATP-binding protein [Spiroplasma eriocheiris]